jgi:hypothetical protein
VALLGIGWARPNQRLAITARSLKVSAKLRIEASEVTQLSFGHVEPADAKRAGSLRWRPAIAKRRA